MVSAGLTIQCAQILWTPEFSLIEYRCAFCQESFLIHCECLVHLKSCTKNDASAFETFPDPASSKTVAGWKDDCTRKEDKPMLPLDMVKTELNQQDLLSESPIASSPEISTHVLNDIENDNDIEMPSSPFDEPRPKDNSEKSTTIASSLDKSHKYSILRLVAKHMPSLRIENDFANALCRNTDRVCDICGFKKRSRRGMLHHMLLEHHPLKIPKPVYQCPMCPKTFTNKSTFGAHKERHSAKFNCEYCGQMFTGKGNMIVHIRIHTGERPYSCKVCGNTFAATNSLNLHMRMHSGEKPFKCSECEKAFRSRTHLRTHMNVHTNSFRKECDVCNKVYTSLESLRLHKKIHTGDRPHKCDVCGKRFVRKNAHSVHMNTHTGNSPYGCKWCERHFHSPAARRSHEKYVHKVS